MYHEESQAQAGDSSWGRKDKPVTITAQTSGTEGLEIKNAMLLVHLPVCVTNNSSLDVKTGSVLRSRREEPEVKYSDNASASVILSSY